MYVGPAAPLGPSRAYALKQLLIAENEIAIVVMRFDSMKPIFSKACAQFVILLEPQDTHGQCVTVGAFDQEPRVTIFDEFRNPANLGRHDCLAQRHGFQQDDAKRLRAGGKDEKLAMLKQRRN